jgi:hypothetical protein
MAKIPDTLRYLFTGDTVRMPNVADVSSRRYPMLMTALGLFKELAEGHGSERRTEGDNVYWEARFGEHETQAVKRWLSWHSQYVLVDSMDQLFVVPVET